MPTGALHKLEGWVGVNHGCGDPYLVGWVVLQNMVCDHNYTTLANEQGPGPWQARLRSDEAEGSSFRPPPACARWRQWRPLTLSRSLCAAAAPAKQVPQQGPLGPASRQRHL
jgi:hypothetical protein